MGITVLREYERGVVFRAGRLRPLKPGVKFLIPWSTGSNGWICAW